MASFEGQTIYIDCQELRKLIGMSLLMMTKQYRVEIGARAFQEVGEVFREFALAYEIEEERWYHFRKMFAEFELLKTDLRLIVNSGILQSPHPMTNMKPSELALKMFERVAKIDEAIYKWKGEICRQDQYRKDAGSPHD